MNTVENYRRRRKQRLVQRMREATDLKEKVRLAVIIYRNCFQNYRGANDTNHKDGGAGSGNWGHEGRPGEVGGSAEGGGVHNRQTTESGGYTSFSKKKSAAAKQHKTDSKEIKSLPKSCTITVKGSGENGSDTMFMKLGDHWFNPYTLESVSFDDEGAYFDGMDVKIYIPDSESPNYNISKADKTVNFEKRFNKAFSPTDAKDYDKEYREQSGDIWNSLNDDEKDSLYSYTGSGYSQINYCLRNNDKSYSSVNEKIENITNAIDASELKQDTILSRGIGVGALESLLKVPSGSITKDNADSVIGKEGTENGFMSTGSISGKGFTSKDVQLEILAPKGTKALYCEPFSALGSGKGRHWDENRKQYDGKSTQSYYSGEMETLVQRGSSLKFVSGGYDESSGKFKYKAIITGQSYS